MTWGKFGAEQVMSKIRVALADDHPVVLAGVKALIQAAPEMDLVGEAADGHAALKLILEAKPDVVVMDISMPGLTGLDLVHRVGGERDAAKILVLTVHEDRAYVQKVLGAGARGYLLKRSAAEELVRAIRAVHGGGLYVDPAIAGKFVKTEGGEGALGEGLALSEREEEVLKLAAQGHTNKEAAARLGLSIKTVESYKSRAMEKLGLKTRAEIVRYGLTRDWLSEA
jgi:DNA-binding NarL/FixJ family response regulator